MNLFVGPSIKDVSNLEESNFIERCHQTEVKKTTEMGVGSDKKSEKTLRPFLWMVPLLAKSNVYWLQLFKFTYFSIFATYLTKVNKDLGTGNGSVVTHMVRIQRLGCRIWISQMVNGESNGECIQAFVSHGPSTFLHQ